MKPTRNVWPVNGDKRSTIRDLDDPALAALRLLTYWHMSDRRRDRRYRFTEPPECVMRTFPDVLVQQAERDIWVAFSREAAVVGETLVLDVTPDDADTREDRQRFPVDVADGQLVNVDGRVCHCIRLIGSDTEARPIRFEQQVRRG